MENTDILTFSGWMGSGWQGWLEELELKLALQFNFSLELCKIVATFFYASRQGQCTHSAQTNWKSQAEHKNIHTLLIFKNVKNRNDLLVITKQLVKNTIRNTDDCGILLSRNVSISNNQV